LLGDFPQLQEVLDERSVAVGLIAVLGAITADGEDRRVGLREEDVRRNLLGNRRSRLVREQADHLVELVVGVPLLVRTGVTDERTAATNGLDLREPAAPGVHLQARVAGGGRRD